MIPNESNIGSFSRELGLLELNKGKGSNGLFGSLEREESRGEESSGEKSRGEWFPSTLFECF